MRYYAYLRTLFRLLSCLTGAKYNAPPIKVQSPDWPGKQEIPSVPTISSADPARRTDLHRQALLKTINSIDPCADENIRNQSIRGFRSRGRIAEKPVDLIL